MYNKTHYILFVIIQALISSLIFFNFPFENSKNSIISYLAEIPGWLIITFFKMPKRDKKYDTKWRERFTFCFFLGYGTSALFLILGVVGASFFAAVTGFDMSKVLIGSFIPLHTISLMLATWFFSKEVERLKYYGLDYQNNFHESGHDEDFVDASEPEKLETLKMLTILDLDTKVGSKNLKNRYFELSKLYHPDRLAQLKDEDRQVAEIEFKRIKKAYDFLQQQIKEGKL